ncbi:hypothetical protein FHS90_001959 [Rufibacter quisquiliarum]|uniref:Uncharacterized protein n=1 Tax=Rufibacter quisquiliarum TaxID=1549639 RepID=A0A839GS43_9BACT|nr:hypothetical protein [Rufibacter quisquiliarum]
MAEIRDKSLSEERKFWFSFLICTYAFCFWAVLGKVAQKQKLVQPSQVLLTLRGLLRRRYSGAGVDSVSGVFSGKQPRNGIAVFLLTAGEGQDGERDGAVVMAKQLAQTLAGLKDTARSFEQAVQRWLVYGTRLSPSQEWSNLACVGQM